MDDYLPAALLHLREADIIRLCGLARAARGQEYERTGQARQAEREAGTLRASILEGAAPRSAQARFADLGLDAWECSCSPSPDPTASGGSLPCEHVAALLYLWVRDPGQFRVAGASPESVSALIASDRQARVRQQGDVALPEPASAPDAPAPLPLAARLEQLDSVTRRFLHLLALAEGGVTEDEAQRLFTRLGLGEPEEALSALERLRLRGLAQPVFAAASLSGRASASADGSTGWAVGEAVLAHLPRALPLQPLVRSGGEEAPEQSEAPQPSEAAWEDLPSAAGLREQRATFDLPALFFLLVAQMVDRTALALEPAPTQKIAARSTYDLDAALAQRWAQSLGAAPEQLRFGLALLRLLGFAPQPAPAPSDAARSQSQPETAEGVRQGLAPASARETLLRAYRLLLGRPSVEVAPDLFQHWLHAHSARELVDLRDAGVRVASLSQRETRHAPDIAAENQAARQVVVRLLRWAPAGRWWSFGSLVEFLWRFQPGFLRGQQQTFLRPQWWLERLPDGQPLSLDVRAEWRQGEGRYLALLMRRALHWQGIVDLALDAQGRLQGFRITPTGAFLLGAAPAALAEGPRGAPPGTAAHRLGRASGASEAPPGDSGAPVPPGLAGGTPLAANLFAEALQPLEAGALLAPLAALSEERLETLLWWCEPAGAAAAGLRFLPSAERAAAALDAGQDVQAWLAWLEQSPLSALVEQGRRWAAMYGQVRVDESAMLLEVADPALLRELEATLNLSEQFIDHLLAPGLAVLRPDAADALVSELQRRGYTPWMSDDL